MKLFFSSRGPSVNHRSLTFRVAAWLLVPGQILLSVPQVASAAPPPARDEKAPEPPKVKVNRTLPAVKPPALVPRFSAIPTDDEIFRARVFDEPLVPIGSATSASDNRALADALLAYLNAGQAEDVAPLTSYLESRPASPWRVALLTDLGIVYRRTGYFSRALEVWEEAWRGGKSAPDMRGRAIADRALGELVELNGRLGRFDRLRALFSEADGREVRGSAAEKLAGARSGYEFMETRPEDAFRCGPMAIDRILAYGNPAYRRDKRIVESRSTSKGTSLVQMRELAGELGLRMQVAKRDKAAPVLVPALVHWKAGHFAALVAENGGRYLIQDPTFGDELWVTREALDTEGSGYFLVAEGGLPEGWQRVALEEASTIWGKGLTSLFEPEETKCDSVKAKSSSCQGGKCAGMADYNFHSLLVSLNIMDTPVGYRPPVGPGVDFTLTYNQRDAFQPQVFSYSNVGYQWTFDWVSYIEDNPSNLTQSVTVYRRGGGRETYSGFNSGSQSYAPHMQSRAVVVRTSVSPIRYERRLANGSVEVFSQSDGAASPRRVFMTDSRTPQWTSPPGATDPNAVRYYYEGTQWGLRLVSVKDGIDQVTTLSYENASDPLKITRVTDPFGRFATLEYNVAGQLERITDVIGIESSFAYGPGDFVNALTTPYGTTRFRFGQAGTQRWLEAEDPLGAVERVEFRHNAFGIPGNEPAVPAGVTVINQWMEFRNTFYWDKRAMALYPGNYSKARITHFLHGTDVNVASGVVESTKSPLEGRVWYTYPDQNQGPAYIGSQAQPTAIARVLDDGATQVYTYEYNALGRVTRKTDPLGRTIVFNYASNGIDLAEVRQVNGQSTDLLAGNTYNGQHQPLTITDASGQTTTNTYNAQGQVATITTPPRAGIAENRTTTYDYDTNGYLQSVTGPATGSTTTYTYDGYGRVRTVADSEGHTTTTDYDALDRPTRVTYPDATYEQTVYNRLDAEGRRDRLGRWTHTFFDALRRPVSARDALGRTNTLEWCACGSLDKVIDASGNATSYGRDLQGRVTSETRADSGQLSYVYENTTSRLHTRTDLKGQVKTFIYLADGRPSQITYTNASVSTPTVAFTYDPVYGRVSSMSDGTGITNYTYNPVTAPPGLGAARIQSVDGPLANDTITYSYDELGRVTTRGLSTFSTTSAYDALGRFASLVSPVGTFNWTYVNTTGRPQTVTYPNGQITTYSYFNNVGDQRLQEIKHQQASGGAILSQFDYTYDAVGSIGTWRQQLGTSPAKIYSYGYDPAQQLTSAVQKDASTQQTLKNYGYAYDAAGNKTVDAQDATASTGTYNNRNELLQQTVGAALPVAGVLSEPGTVTVNSSSASVNAANQFAGVAQVGAGTQTITVMAKDPSGNVRTNTYQIAGHAPCAPDQARNSVTARDRIGRCIREPRP